jgi:hypothetical protein
MTRARVWWQAHRKAVAALAGALLTLTALVIPQTSKYYALIPAFAGVLGVHLVPNTAPVKPEVK